MYDTYSLHIHIHAYMHIHRCSLVHGIQKYHFRVYTKISKNSLTCNILTNNRASNFSLKNGPKRGKQIALQNFKNF